jgi:hypothetical protein
VSLQASKRELSAQQFVLSNAATGLAVGCCKPVAAPRIPARFQPCFRFLLHGPPMRARGPWPCAGKRLKASVAPLPPAAPPAVWAPPAMTSGTKAKVNAKSGTAAKSPASSPMPTPAGRSSPHLGLLVHRTLRLELHLRQRRPHGLRLALRCGQRHSEAERHCPAGAAD